MPTFAELDVPPADAPGPASHRRGHFDNRELSTIALLAALHFAVSFAARLFGYALFAFLGPFAVYVDGIGGEAIPSLLLAVAVMLVPRVGTAVLSISTVWLLNVLVTGTFSVVSAAMVIVSMAAHEVVLRIAGITHLGASQLLPSSKLPASLVVRSALAIGIANSIALYAQFFISMKFYDFYFSPLYIHSVALLTGLGYGAVGAAVGTAWGFQLRRAAP